MIKQTKIGAIISDWKIINLEDIIQLDRGITYGIVQPGSFDPNGRFLVRGKDYSKGWVQPDEFFKVSSKVEEPYKRARLKKNDLITTIVGAGVGNMEIVPEWLEGANITQTTARIAIDNKKADYRFYYQVLNSWIGQMNVRLFEKGGAQPGLNLGDIKKYTVPLPPLPEQQKIAEILSTVDDKIEIIDQQITQTQELKKGLIQLLLTKGIGHTEFKDSTLGIIPKSWEVVKLSDITEQIKDGTHATHKEVAGGIPLLSAKDIRNGQIYIPNDCRKLSQEDFNSIHKNFKLKDGDVMLTVVGSIGRVAVINNYNDNYTFQRSVGYIRLDNYHNSYFFKQYFQSDIFIKQLLLRSNASAQAGVYLGELGKIPVVSLPIEEQTKIAEILNSVDDKLEVLLEKKVSYQELKQGLMQQLLTGKIRVKVY